MSLTEQVLGALLLLAAIYFVIVLVKKYGWPKKPRARVLFWLFALVLMVAAFAYFWDSSEDDEPAAQAPAKVAAGPIFVAPFPQRYVLKKGGVTETPVIPWVKPPAGSGKTWWYSWQVSGDGCVAVIANGKDIGDDCSGEEDDFQPNDRLDDFGPTTSTKFVWSKGSGVIVDFFVTETRR